MLKRMTASVLFDRPVDLKIHDVTPGGGVMTFGDKCVTFGFLDFYLYPSENDPCVVDIEQEWLDTECYPEAEAITEEDVAALKEIHEYSVSTGEETGAPLCCPVKILRLTFDFMDENGNGTSVDCTGLDAVKNYEFADKEPVLPNAGGEVMEEGPAKAAEEADSYILIRVSDDELPEFLGQVIDVVDDFLEERDITLPDSEKEMEEDGDESNSAVIYGSDYGQLYEQFEELFRNWADSRPE